MKKFNNKVIVITGAAGGIGKALTGRFLEEGATVCAVDISEEKLEELYRKLIPIKIYLLL